MLSKTRTTIIALVASASFAVATVAPAVSQARPNNGAYAKSQAAHLAINQQAELCQNLKDGFDNEVNEGAYAKNIKEAEAHWKTAEYFKSVGQENGCAWAA